MLSLSKFTFPIGNFSVLKLLLCVLPFKWGYVKEEISASQTLRTILVNRNQPTLETTRSLFLLIIYFLLPCTRVQIDLFFSKQDLFWSMDGKWIQCLEHLKQKCLELWQTFMCLPPLSPLHKMRKFQIRAHPSV